MRRRRKVELKEKGWSDEKIREAEIMLEKELKHDTHYSKIVFWTAIIVTVLGNFFVSLVLIPLLLFMQGWVLYSVVIVLAFLVGYLYNFLITDIGHLKLHHHLAASILIPLLALGNIIAMMSVAEMYVGQTIPHQSGFVAFVFTVFFLLPYIIDRIRHHIKR